MARNTTFTGKLAALLIAAVCVAAGAPPVPAFAAAGSKSDSEKFLQDAKNYLKKGDVNAAVIQLKNALQADPGNVAARKELGTIYLRVGNGPAAEKEFKAAQRRGSADKDLSVLIAEAYLLQGKFDAVIKEVEDDVSDPKLRTNVLIVRARALFGLNRPKEAQDSFLAAEKLSPKNPLPKVGLSRLLISQGNLKDAEQKIDEALAVNDKLSEAHLIKGEIRRFGRDLEGAATSFDKALKLNPNNLPARLGKAAALIDLNKDTQAQAELQLVFQRIPKHPLASYLSALLLTKKKDMTGAQEALQQAAPALDDHMPSVFLSGAIQYALNQLEQAATNLTRYVAAVPGNDRARKLLGATLVRKGEAQRAIDTLLPLVEKGQNDPQVLSLLGSAYMRLGKYAQGTEYFEKAAEAAPDAASIRTQLALSHLAQGASDKAVSDLEAAVDLNTDSQQAGIILALVRLRKGEFDEAIKAAQKLEKALPKNPLPLNLLGAANLGKGNFAEARKSFERALEVKSDFHPARMNLAQLDLRENKVDAAIAHYETIVKQDPKNLGAMMALAEVAARQGRNDDVLSWLQKAGDANPKNTAPKLRLIRHYEQIRDQRRAVAVARELDATAPNNPQVLEALGRAEAASGDLIGSVATFRRLVQLAPKAPRAYVLLAAAQANSNDVNGAKSNYRKAIELNADFTAAYLALAELESKQGNTAEALKVAATLIDKAPKAAIGDMLVGDIRMRAKEYDKARAAYDAALKKEDTGVLALRRFNAMSAGGKTSEALDWLQGWVDRKGEPGVRQILASNYIAAKKYELAIRETEIMLKKDADSPVLLNNLAWLYDQKGDKRARDFAERALKLAPRAPAVMDTLGWILSRAGENDRAANILRQAHELAPKVGDIAYHYAVALKNTGKKPEAKRVIERILAEGSRFSEADNARALLKELGG